ncbi:mycofactocin-coupled SDR family oxidoreductase [Streptomyces sp. NBC_01750]|uniref:mycofactocin-coupled SDR family oxidoreductase n=1 Tax=Streptomyces sp. NBC_01750 TaxID=2975928 RepID=UPI002DDAAE9B|nr:mycofactocin-coupled SDR family oxidoreductase [Streptomyces sp. NBC_01750]WSD35887.1 mycofactocin-coupled SDR family oxidoreductase [Streptomyces sp. NBC_01750]
MGRVDGKVVAITGAARGQGRSHALRLAEEGADIVALDICQEIPVADYGMASGTDLEETAELVRKTGRRAVVKQVDVRDRPALDRAFTEAVEELGRLDVVVANAGISPVGMNRPLSAFTETIDVNLLGSISTVHAALPHLADGSSIIVMGSVAGLAPELAGNGVAGPGGYGYSFSKKTLIDYVNWLAVQLAPKGTRVNAVHPGNVATRMVQNESTYRTYRPDLENPTEADAEVLFRNFHAMGVPLLDPIDISHAVVYLASDESRYLTGVQLKIDAGALAQREIQR